MLFNSWQFAIFFMAIFFIYYLIPYKYRWTILLISSYYFYMCWKPELIILILIETIVHYFIAIKIEQWSNMENKRKTRKLFLVFSIIISLGILFFYKYFNFFSVSFREVLHIFSIPYEPVILRFALPIGISFYTFKALSYTIDVYNGKIKAERNFGYFGLYISFFPQLLAGPIERADKFLPQIKMEHKFEYENVTYGLKQIAIGLFKKIVIADTLAKGVNVVYDNVQLYSGVVLVAATVMFTFQIYCDFSGYSDIAIGCAKVMGINTTKNFKNPYLSHSIKEFWSRWHISLSTWFRDYVYIPIGGNRVSKLRNYFNLMVTFLLSGLWHGASWNFVIWGGLHGVYQMGGGIISSIFLNKHEPYNNKFYIKTRGFIKICFTFILVCFAWIFFRANTINDAFYVISNMFKGINNPYSYLITGTSCLNISKLGKLAIVFELLILFIIDIAETKIDIINWVSNKKTPLRWSIYLAFCTMIVLLSSKGISTKFIYFQF